MNPNPDREALLQSALDGGGEMSERDLAAFARALIDDGAFAEDYLVSRRMIDDLALLQDEIAVPDIAGRVMARLPEPAPKREAPALAGWIAIAAAGAALATAGGFYFADSLGAPLSEGLNALLDFPAQLWSGLATSSFAGPAGVLAPSQLWLAAGAAAILAVFSHGWALSAGLGRSHSHDSRKGR